MGFQNVSFNLNDKNMNTAKSVSFEGGKHTNLTSGANVQAKTSTDDLKDKFVKVQKKQGFIGKTWNKFKNATGLGLSSNDIEEKIKQYENGEISYKEVLESIQSYDSKQNGMVEIAANAASGLAVAASAIFTGGTSLIAGAAIGGAVKAGIKTADRATNEVANDALDAKQIIKDGVTGAVDGAVTVATAGMAKAPVLGQSVGKAAVTGAVQGAKAGAISGAASSAASYTVNAAVEEDVDFSFKELAHTTAQGAAAGGVLGGVCGGAAGGVAQAKLNTPEVRQLAGNLGMQDGDIHDSEILSDYLAKNKKLDVNDLNNYIENVDTDSLYQAAPRVESYTPEQKMKFYDYHYKSGTTTWDASTLSLDDDLTQFLQKNYTNADQMDELLDIYPMTDRKVGAMPEGWLDAVAPENQAAAQQEIYEAISKFQTSESIDDFAADLTRITGKNVQVQELGQGSFGTGYKVSMDGADDTVLKLFNSDICNIQFEMYADILKKFGKSDAEIEAYISKQKRNIANVHGQNIETQTGLFVNEHSDDFVKMYFGQVAGKSDTDAYLVTQYLDSSVTPVKTGGNGGYKIKSKDAWSKDSLIGQLTGDHNIINGKIIDFGAVQVKKKAFGKGA